jgi:phosphoribosylformimino-5-aminoimidazole carboxamide ribotide isomerase
MRKFKIIPVLDILNSEIVHAIKGERKKYKPLKSKLFNSSDPLEILDVLSNKFQFNDFYIADLDAILYKKPNRKVLDQILKISEINIIIDPGIVDSNDIVYYSKLNIHKLIIGLETIKSLDEVIKGLRILGTEKLIISIDMYKENVLTSAKDLRNRSLFEIISKIKSLGIKDIILLDLYRVGQKLGGIPPIYLEIQEIFEGNVYVGGGIKDYKDILSYIRHKFTGILVATALYDGSLEIEKVRKIENEFSQ